MDTSSVPSLRRCSKCGEEKPATPEFFHRSKYMRDGLNHWCKSCMREYGQQYRSDHKEYERERVVKWRTENRERFREYHRQYRAQNSQQTRAAIRHWTQTHPDKKRAKEQRRRARKRALPATFTAEHERLALDYFHGCCAICGRQLNDLFGTHRAAMDHWIPVSKGGGSTPDNMIPLCHGIGGCNNLKGAKDPIEWLASQYPPKRVKETLRRIMDYFDWIRKSDQ